MSSHSIRYVTLAITYCGSLANVYSPQTHRYHPLHLDFDFLNTTTHEMQHGAVKIMAKPAFNDNTRLIAVIVSGALIVCTEMQLQVTSSLC